MDHLDVEAVDSVGFLRSADMGLTREVLALGPIKTIVLLVLVFFVFLDEDAQFGRLSHFGGLFADAAKTREKKGLVIGIISHNMIISPFATFLDNKILMERTKQGDMHILQQLTYSDTSLSLTAFGLLSLRPAPE